MGRKCKPKTVKSKLSSCQWANFIDSECEICTRLYPENFPLVAWKHTENPANTCLSPQGIISPNESINARYHHLKSRISTLESTTFLKTVFIVIILD